jgi:hypothetical protein
MAKRLLLIASLTLACSATTVSGVTAKGLSAAVQGATVSGLPYRYVAIAPNSPYRSSPGKLSRKFTVVGRIDKRGGRLGRWWYLPGQYSIPAGAYDDRVGGLSHDGSTLVLSRFSWIYPPRTTRFAIIGTRLQLRHPRKAGDRRPRHAITRVSLPGGFTFDAISPDGSTIYLIEHLTPVFAGPYQVRAFDTKRGELLPEPVVDPEEPQERMEGEPISRVTGPDGRWAYTLYSDHERGRWDQAHKPFIHALDTVAQRAVCIDLPQLEGRRIPSLALRVSRDGRDLGVLDGQRTLIAVDTRSFAVRKPAPLATASSGTGPLPQIAALGAIAALLLGWIGLRHRRTGEAGQTERR